MNHVLLALSCWLGAGANMLDSNNGIRAEYSLPVMREDASLSAAAQEQAEYLAAREHVPDPRNLMATSSHYQNGRPMQRAVRHGFSGSEVSENIVQGTKRPWVHWRSSPTHFANILSNRPLCGFGHAVSPRGADYWVALYGSE